MKFVKMHGCGNSYIYMDVRGKHLSDEYLGSLSEKVSDKNKGIGSDGLIVLDDSQVADGRMRMYNADGSEGAMCGNGIRCLAKLMYERAGIRKNVLTVETKSGIKTVKVVLEDGIVTGATVDMGSPDFEAAHIPVFTETEMLKASRKSGSVPSAGGKAHEKHSRNFEEEPLILLEDDEPQADTKEEMEEIKLSIVLDEEGEPMDGAAEEEENASVALDEEEMSAIGIVKKMEKEVEISVFLDGDDLTGENAGQNVKAHPESGSVKEEFINQPILIKNGDGDIEDFTITCVSMGNPHAVTFVDTIHREDFAVIGPEFENNAIFPDRINTEFVKKIDRGHVKMRVWERGSGETMACGTGACATVAVGVKTGRLDTRVEVEMTGGTLSLFYDTEKNHIYMTGEAVEICEGELAM